MLLVVNDTKMYKDIKTKTTIKHNSHRTKGLMLSCTLLKCHNLTHY